MNDSIENYNLRVLTEIYFHLNCIYRLEMGGIYEYNEIMKHILRVSFFKLNVVEGVLSSEFVKPNGRVHLEYRKFSFKSGQRFQC